MTEKYQKQGGWYNRIVNAFSLLLVLSLAFVFIYIATNGKINIDLLKELLPPAPLEVQTNPQMNHPPSDLQVEPQTDLSSEQQISSQTNTSTELQVDKPKTDASATLQVDTRRDKPKTDSEEKRPSETDTLFVPDVTPTLVNGIKKAQSLTDLLILGAVDQYGVTNSYNGSYQKLSYPNGDVDISTGVCTDVVIRAFRSIKIDLQKEIHQDMSRHFRKYPRKWGLKSTDRNIDHRRVPNMEAYFTRKGYKVPIGENTDTKHYLPGDLVVWRISGKLTHIGIVSDEIVPDTSRYFIIHNPVQGVEISDWLNEFEIINHFRFVE